MSAEGQSFRAMSFREYWKTYFPDLIAPLTDLQRQGLLENLFDGFIDEVYVGREIVQRLTEEIRGIISTEQYLSWAVSGDDDDGSAHILAHLIDGEYVGGCRLETLKFLANIDYSESFARRIRWAGERALLSPCEVNRILATSLRNPPLPAIRPCPEGVPELPFTRVYSARQCEHAEAC